MPDTTPAAEKNPIEEMFDQPLTEPETSDGIGPTLGEDLTPEHERAEDARYRREHTLSPSRHQAELRSFAPVHADVLRAGRSA